MKNFKYELSIKEVSKSIMKYLKQENTRMILVE